MVVVQQYD